MSESDRHRNGLTIDQDAQTPQQSELQISSQSKLRGVPTYPNPPSGETALKTIETMTTTKTKTIGKTPNGSPQGRTQQPKSKKTKKPTKQMKAKNSNPKVDDARRQFGKVQSDGTELSVPSAEGIPGVETEPTSEQKTSSNTENVTPKKGENFDEMLPSTPSLSSPKGTAEESEELGVRAAMAREDERKRWNARLNETFRFERFCGFDLVTFYLLFFEGQIYVSADYVARAATYGDGLGSEMGYTAAEIIGTLDWHQLIEVPGPEIPANSDGAVGGIYIVLEVLCSMLHDGRLAHESRYFADLLDEFEREWWAEHTAELQEMWIEDANRLRAEKERKWHQEHLGDKARQRVWKAKLLVQYTTLREEKLRSEKQKP